MSAVYMLNSVGDMTPPCGSSVLCVLMVEGMYFVVNVMYLMSVVSPPPSLCNLSSRTVVKLCTLVVFSLGVSLVSLIVMIYACGP